MSEPEIRGGDSLETAKPEASVRSEICKTSEAVRLLLADGGIEDVNDKKTIESALVFLENPTEDLEVAEGHLMGIGMVLAYRYSEIKDQPPALSDMNRRLFSLASQLCIKRIEAECKKDEPDTPGIQKLVETALNYGGVLAKYYGDNAWLNRAVALQELLGTNA